MHKNALSSHQNDFPIVHAVACKINFSIDFCNLVLASEGSDWAKVGSEASDWPSAVPLPPSSTGPSESGGHKLESMLEKLGFSEYLPLFQVQSQSVSPLRMVIYLTLLDCVEE